MSHWYLFSVATICTIFGVIISYTPFIRNTNIGVAAGVFLAIMTNSIWFKITKLLVEPDKIYRFGAIWDLMFAVSWFVLPLLFFQVKIDFQGLIGLLFVAVGVTLLNVGKLF